MDVEVDTVDDETEPVTVARIKTAILNFVQRSDRPDQLLVYFSGHGVNKGFAEFWLLSNAPNDPDEAVNVNGSVDVARYMSGIPHIIFISDACRTPAATIYAQTIGGSLIFPNRAGEFEPSVIDRFYAARPGHPALEIREAADDDFRALYTECMLQALEGAEPAVREPLVESNGLIEIVTPRRLKGYLATALPARASALRVKRALNPDAQVESDYPAYLSRFAAEPPPRADDAVPEPPRRKPLPFDDQERLLGELLQEAFDTGRSFEPGVTRPIAADAQRLLAAGRLIDHTTRPGFAVLVSGRDRLAFARCATASCEVAAPATSAGPAFVTVVPNDRSPRVPTVLLSLVSGRSMLLPALADHVGVVVINGDELVDVTYERVPAAEEQSLRVRRVRQLRAAVSAASRQARFHVAHDSAQLLEIRLNEVERSEPTLDLYAAYAFSEAGRIASVERIAERMLKDVGAVFFDVAMLARRAAPDAAERLSSVAGVCPLLTQGWTMLGSKGLKLPESLTSMQRHLLPSLWTFFAAPAGETLHREIDGIE